MKTLTTELFRSGRITVTDAFLEHRSHLAGPVSFHADQHTMAEPQHPQIKWQFTQFHGSELCLNNIQ